MTHDTQPAELTTTKVARVIDMKLPLAWLLTVAGKSEATKRVESSTSELVEMFKAFQGAFQVLQYIGKLAKPLGAIIGAGVAVAAAWTAFRGTK